MQKKHFSENDIRPKKFDGGRLRAFFEDVATLNGQKNHFVLVNCPACGSKKNQQKFSKFGFHYVECDSCETLFMNPRPSQKVLDEFYKNSSAYTFWNKYIFPSSEKIRREKIFKPRVDKILEVCKKYRIKTKSVLEVGAGFGTFCEEMNSRNVFRRVVAVEPTPELASTCRQKSIEVIELPIEKIFLEKSQKFNVIVNFEVIEHLFNPNQFIKSCKKSLLPGGLLVITCPNGKGFDFLTLGKDCNSIDHEHLNYFNPESISKLISKNGLKVLEVITPGRLDAELVRNKINEGVLDISNQLFLKTVLIKKWEEIGSKFQNFISENGLSSSMWVIAKNN